MYAVGEAMDSRMLPRKSEWMGAASVRVRGQAPQIQLARQSRAFCWSLDRPALAVPANLVAWLPLDRGQVEWNGEARLGCILCPSLAIFGAHVLKSQWGASRRGTSVFVLLHEFLFSLLARFLVNGVLTLWLRLKEKNSMSMKGLVDLLM